MSKAESFWCHEASNIRCVRESDYARLEQDCERLREALQKFEDLGIVVGNKTWPELDEALTTAAKELAKPCAATN